MAGDDSGSDRARLRLFARMLRRVCKDGLAVARALDSVQKQNCEHMRLIDHHDRKKGNRFEHEVERLCVMRGLDVRPRYDGKHDRVINGKRTQIKRKDTDRVSLLTTPIVGRDYCGYLSCDWDVLVLQNKGTTYVIPAAVLLHDDGQRIRNHIDPSQYSQWINRWEVFGEGFCVLRESQRTLFRGEKQEAMDGR